MAALPIVGLVLLGLWGLAVLVVAVMSRSATTMAFPPTFERWRAEDMPDELDAVYASVAKDLEELGFGAVGGLTIDAGAGVTHSLLLEHDDGTLAVLEHMTVGPGEGRASWGLFTFTPVCGFISTWCSRVWLLPLGAPAPTGLRVNLAVDDPRRVVALHRRLLAELLTTPVEPLPDAIERFQLHVIESQRAGLGWRWSTSHGRTRLTLLGALVHAATAVPPLFFVGRARAASYERACLATEKGPLDAVRSRFAAARALHLSS